MRLADIRQPICPVNFNKIVCTVNSNKPVSTVNSGKAVRPITSSKPLCPIDVCFVKSSKFYCRQIFETFIFTDFH